jgi:hypothetical protein
LLNDSARAVSQEAIDKACLVGICSERAKNGKLFDIPISEGAHLIGVIFRRIFEKMACTTATHDVDKLLEFDIY